PDGLEAQRLDRLGEGRRVFRPAAGAGVGIQHAKVHGYSRIGRPASGQAGRITSTVAVACGPAALRTVTSTVTRAEPSSRGLTELTVPVNVAVAPGRLGVPRRTASRRSTASGPAQSVMKRPMSPLVVQMFMTMSPAPTLSAYAWSWWIRWKSRDAMAPV